MLHRQSREMMFRNKSKVTSKRFFTVVGLRHLGLDTEFIKAGMELELEKEPDNKYDKEAIMVKMEGLGKIGYVANSTHTVVGESYSAGRLYDTFGEKTKARVKYNMGDKLLGEVEVYADNIVKL